VIVDNTSSLLRRAWHPVAMAHELGDGPHQVWLLGTPWVVARLHGELVAFEDRCPHRLAPLSLGSIDDRLGLRCGYHGWTFDDDGRCTSIPALGPDAHLPPKARLLPAWGVAETNDLVWLAPEEPLAPMPTLPLWRIDGVDSFWNEPVTTTVSAVQLVDNVLDAAHVPFVHAETFGVDEAALVVNEPVERDGWTVRTTFDTWYRNLDDPLVATGEHPEVQPQRLRKEGSAGCTVRLRLDFPVTGASFSILFACQPETADRTRIYKLMARDDLGGDPDRIASTIADELVILEEDLHILERYPAMQIHLDRTECHTRGDRLSVAWRRLLADMATVGAETPVAITA
jgi:phenylpropionate dioxygenase-like ring-hydroxylating dioxygenase large terminal subunit